jgi:hypothetical protein
MPIAPRRAQRLFATRAIDGSALHGHLSLPVATQHPNRSRWFGPVLALQVRLLARAGDNLCRGFGGFSCADHPGSLSLPHTISATSRPELGDRELVETPPKDPSAPGTSCSLRVAS